MGGKSMATKKGGKKLGGKALSGVKNMRGKK